MEEKRLRILKLDIHPIATHFAVGGAILLTLVFFVQWIFGNIIFGVTLGYGGVLDFFVIWQPIFTVLTFLTGLMDGKLRYKKFQTLYLRRKIFLGIGMFASALFVVIFHFTSATGTNIPVFVLEGVFIVVTLAFGGALGMIGGQLTCNVVPRGREIDTKPEAKAAKTPIPAASTEENEKTE